MDTFIQSNKQSMLLDTRHYYKALLDTRLWLVDYCIRSAISAEQTTAMNNRALLWIQFPIERTRFSCGSNKKKKDLRVKSMFVVLIVSIIDFFSKQLVIWETMYSKPTFSSIQDSSTVYLWLRTGLLILEFKSKPLGWSSNDLKPQGYPAPLLLWDFFLQLIADHKYNIYIFLYFAQRAPE